MGQCEHEFTSKFCPECGSSAVRDDSNATDHTDPGQSNESGSTGNSSERTSVPDDKGSDSGQRKELEAKEGVSQVRRRSGPRVVRVTTAKKKEPSKSTQTSVGTKRIVKKALPGKKPAIKTRVKTNIEMKQEREKEDKAPKSNSMKSRVMRISGFSRGK